ncbi:MAG: ribbon-helix-helix protein, CopG family [Anaeromyxobacter sp.]
MPRTTLTLEEDVAARLEAEARRSRRPFKEVVNDLLRFALDSRRQAGPRDRFRVEARDLGLRKGFDYTNVAALLEQAEGEDHR